MDKADQLEDALREAFGHDGPALVEVRTARQELSLPADSTSGEIKGFTSTRPGPSCPEEEKNSSSSPRPTGGNLTPNDEATRIHTNVRGGAAGDERPRRYWPNLRYELIGCGLHGHELLGTDAAVLRGEDGLFARGGGGKAERA